MVAGSIARAWFTQNGTSDNAEKIVEVGYLYASYSAGYDFESILTVKMETRHPVLEGYFGSEFPGDL